MVFRSLLASNITWLPDLVPETSYEPSGSLRTLVTMTEESFAFTAAVTLAASSPVTGVSADPPRSPPKLPLAEYPLADEVLEVALASAEPPKTRAPAARAAPTARPILLEYTSLLLLCGRAGDVADPVAGSLDGRPMGRLWK